MISTLVLWWLVFSQSVPTPQPEFNGRCHVCMALGLESGLYGGWGTTTLVAAISYYDEKGEYHYCDPNTTTTYWKCGRGHSFSVSSRGDDCFKEPQQQGD